MNAIDLSQFEVADEANSSDLIRYLQAASSLPGVRRCKQVALAELRLRPGHSVLDVGCGYGADVLAMARRVGSAGRATGVDLSENMIREARQRATGLPVTFETADARRLRFAGATFDACRAERLLQHVPDPAAAVAEMARVTRPGGRVVAIEFDLGGVILDSPDRGTTRRVLAEVADSTVNGWAGRQLPRLFKDAGLSRVRIRAELVLPSQAFLEQIYTAALGRIIAADDCLAGRLDAWSSQLRADASTGRFFAAAPAFIVSATR
ncbi:MAG: methyltransferase domain-containing protein [Streptosporangiaceae bacterium]